MGLFAFVMEDLVGMVEEFVWCVWVDAVCVCSKVCEMCVLLMCVCTGG